MSANRSTNNFDLEDEDDDLVESLRDNIGRIITVFTQSGGCSGRGFTGLLVAVNCRTIRLITSLPSGPRHPFGSRAEFDFDDFDFERESRRRRFERSRFGTSIIIPIRKIVSVVFNEQ